MLAGSVDIRVTHIITAVFTFPGRIRLLVLSFSMFRHYMSVSYIYQADNRGYPVGVVRVVVVYVPARVHIPRIVRIATIRRAQTNGLSY